jgi:type IV pilus biogenesis protein PilP
MSQIAKTLISGIIAASLGTTVAAQDTSQSDILAKLMDQATKSGAADVADHADPLRDLIRQRVMDLASGSRGKVDASGVTIGEIDHLNRSAERTKTQLELERLEMQRTQTEIDSLIMLYEALSKLEEKSGENDEQFQQGFRDQEPQAPAPAILSPQEEEMGNLPTVHGIVGSGGVYTAQISTTDGTNMSVTKGDILPYGFFVEEVTRNSMSVRGEVNEQPYFLMPKSVKQMQQNEQENVPPAMDMNGMPPFGIF